MVYAHPEVASTGFDSRDRRLGWCKLLFTYPRLSAYVAAVIHDGFGKMMIRVTPLAPAPGRIPVSAFIIARDEAERLPATLESLRSLVDEIVVVEWGSTDDTVAIARSYGAEVVHHPWSGYGPQKQFAETCCRHRWLLNLDADEALSPALQTELRRLFSDGSPALDAYRLVIRAVCPHEQQPTRWAYANTPVRLYDRERGRFSSSSVHDSVLLEPAARVGQLRGDVHHRGMLSFDQLIAKINGYTTLQAHDYIARRTDRVSWWKLCTVLPAAFFKSFILRRHFLWGRYGLSISMSYAFARFLRLAKIHEQALLRDSRGADTRPVPSSAPEQSSALPPLEQNRQISPVQTRSRPAA